VNAIRIYGPRPLCEETVAWSTASLAVWFGMPADERQFFGQLSEAEQAELTGARLSRVQGSPQ
jgi:hypothetical protein